MSKRVLAFGASNSSRSINKKFASWAVSQLEDVKATIIDLNDFEMPLYSIDREEVDGIPKQAHTFRKMISDSDGLIISFAEHNGAYSVAFKNIFDWASRIGKDIWDHKPMLLMATSPGKRGGKSVLDHAVLGFGFMGAGMISHFSLPSFGENFDSERGITDESLFEQFKAQLHTFSDSL